MPRNMHLRARFVPRSILVVAMVGLVPAVALATAGEVHVSPAGNDTAAGTAEKPLKSLEAARRAVRKQLAADSNQSVSVVLHAGTYYLDDTFTLTPDDSGTQESPVVYRAVEGAEVVLSGGRPIRGWKSGQGGLWQVEIPAVREGKWYFHQLFVDGERRQRSRTPNEGYLRTDGPALPYKHDKQAIAGVKEIRNAFKFKAGDLSPQWKHLDDVNLVLYHSWTNSRHWIDRIDTQKNVVQLLTPSQWPVSWWEKEQRYHVENVREALDAPGEWYLDRETGILEYWPLPGENMATVEVVAPVLEQLVVVQGDWETGRLVHDIRFEDIHFQHADWRHADKQQPLDGQSGNTLPGAIQISGAERISLVKCEIAHVGAYGLFLEAGCKHNRIVQCEIHDLGAGGVRIGETMRQKTKSKDGAAEGAAVLSLTFEGTGPRDTGHNVVDNCFIHDGGHIFAAGTGVFIAHSGFNQITHNEISDFRYSGVCVGWVWGFGQSVAHHNRISDNHIHHLGWGVLSDMGGVYTLGPSPGTMVAHNHIHHVCSYSYGGWGLYTDEGSSEIVMENNLVHDTKTGGFHQHYGRDNRIRNNILAFSREAQVQRSREDLPNSVIFERNIVYSDNDQMLIRAWRNGDYQVDHNLYWSTSPATPLFDQRDFREWQATSGQDQHSLLADPKFVDAANRDFRLQPDSPAFQVGFEPFPLTGFGLYGDPAWVERPLKVKRPEFVLPPTAAPQSNAIDDGFEEAAVGGLAAQAKTLGEEGDATLRVTDATAASGKHSLKFVDAANLSRDYHPYLYYTLNWRQGMLRAAFDVRRGNGYALRHEWRDDGKPYHVGPSVLFDSDGSIKVGKRTLLKIPADQWARIEILCGVGEKGTGMFDLTVTLPGRKPQRFDDLPCGSREFRRLQWFGFSSTGNQPAELHLDNLKLDEVKQ
ncbi:MAG: right-handed parallel beta-helix repeat-containing protein [Planctomycetota bacterium]